jgi:hypothetical protein
MNTSRLAKQYEGNSEAALVRTAQQDVREASAPLTTSRALYYAWQDGKISTHEYEEALRRERHHG